MPEKVKTISITTLTEPDFETAGIVLDAAYENSGMVERLRANVTLQPDGWLCAKIQDELVGVVGVVNYPDFASIGSMAVHPHAQRQGIALALMQHLLKWLDSTGPALSFLDASAMDAPLYGKLGFIDDGEACRFTSQTSAPIAMSSTQIAPITADDLPALTAFDTPIFGSSRTKVLEPYFARFRGRAFLIRNAAGQIGGYLIAQSKSIGPWAAETPELAEKLFQAALSLEYDGKPSVIFPDANSACQTLLTRYGFAPAATLRHMRRGGKVDPRDCSRIYGQTSFMLG